MLQVNTTAMTDACPPPAKNRTSASLDGFHPERGNLSVPASRKSFPTRWPAFAPVDRINASLDGFRPKCGNLSMSAAIRRPHRPWTVLSRAWGSFAPTAHDPMAGIRPCGPDERPSGRLSSQTRKLVRADRHLPSTTAISGICPGEPDRRLSGRRSSRVNRHDPYLPLEAE